jgi:hypothetical protein
LKFEQESQFSVVQLNAPKRLPFGFRGAASSTKHVMKFAILIGGKLASNELI